MAPRGGLPPSFSSSFPSPPSPRRAGPHLAEVRGPVDGRPAVEGVLGGQVGAGRALEQRAQGGQVAVAAGAMQGEAEGQQLLAGEARLGAGAQRHGGQGRGKRREGWQRGEGGGEGSGKEGERRSERAGGRAKTRGAGCERRRLRQPLPPEHKGSGRGGAGRCLPGRAGRVRGRARREARGDPRGPGSSNPLRARPGGEGDEGRGRGELARGARAARPYFPVARGGGLVAAA